MVTAESASPTLWVTTSEAEPMKSEPSEYTAVTSWSPTDNAAVLSVAAPALSSWTTPMLVVPSKNSTDPAGVAVPASAVTVAVKVTDWPDTDGFGDASRAVVVDTAPTLWVAASASDPWKPASPL